MTLDIIQKAQIYIIEYFQNEWNIYNNYKQNVHG